MRLLELAFSTGIFLISFRAAQSIQVKSNAPESDGKLNNKTEIKFNLRRPDDLYLREDADLWERLLQQSMSLPTPPPSSFDVPQGPASCQLKLTIECFTTIDGTKTQCKDVPTPESTGECMKEVSYEYSIENTCQLGDPDCSSAAIITLSSTRNGIDFDLLGSIDEAEVSIGETILAVEDAGEINFCMQAEIITTTIVEATTTTGNEPEGICEDDEVHSFKTNDLIEPCEIEVETDCYTKLNKYEISCQDIPIVKYEDECRKELKFEYTIKNVGKSEETIISLDRNRNGANENLVNNLETTTLLPGQSTLVTEDVHTDFCVSGFQNNDIIVKATGRKENTQICSDKNEYKFNIEVNCNIGLSIECNYEDISCHDIPPPRNDGECIKYVTYKYILTNLGPVEEKVIAIDRNRDREEISLLKLLDKVTLSPGESIFIKEANEPIDVCNGKSVTSVDVKAKPDGENSQTCYDSDVYSIIPDLECNVSVEIDCYLQESGVPCEYIPMPVDERKCLQYVTYKYTVTNIGPTKETVVRLDRSRAGYSEDLVDLLDRTELYPGDYALAVEKYIEIDFCDEQLVTTEAVVESVPPGEYVSSCFDTGLHQFLVKIKCAVKIDIACFGSADNNYVTSCDEFKPFENVAESFCEQSLKYIYTITNIGPIQVSLNSLEVERNGVVNEFLSGDLALEADGAMSISETILVDYCDDHLYGVTTGAEIEAEPILDGGKCRNEAEYYFQPFKPTCKNINLKPSPQCFIDERRQTCLEYLNEVTDLTDNHQCNVDVIYENSLINNGNDCIPIKSVTSLINHIKSTDIDRSKSTLLCPNETLELRQKDQINICELVGKDIKFEVTVNEEHPSVCGGVGSIDFDFPTEECVLDLKLSCKTPNGDECKLPSKKSSCQSHPTYLELMFTGGSCDTSSNYQSTEVFHCSDHGYGFSSRSSAYVVSTGKNGVDNFLGTVLKGEVLKIENNRDKKKLDASTTITIYDEEEGVILQTLTFHTSCSQPLHTSDVYGALTVVGFGNNYHYISTRKKTELIFTYEITNIGEGHVSLDEIMFEFKGQDEPLKTDLSGVEELGSLITYKNDAKISLFTTSADPVDVAITVHGHNVAASRSDSCEVNYVNTLFPRCESIIECTDRPYNMVFKFTGGTCDESDNGQDFKCKDESNVPENVYIIMASSNDWHEILFEGSVETGDEFAIYGDKKIAADISVFIKSTDSNEDGKYKIIQQSNIHTSCSNNLFLGDVFGAITIAGWEGTHQGRVHIDDTNYNC